MKKLLIAISLLSLFMIGADRPVKVRFTVINKSGYALAIWLTGTAVEPGESFIDLLTAGKWTEKEEQDTITYYFTVPKGSRETPATRTFEIVRGQYTLRSLYTKPWDPVYPNNPCIQQPPKPMFALRNLQVTYTPCFLFPRRPGEPSMMKFWELRKQVLY